MKKWIALLLVAVMAVSAFAGCTTNEQPANTDTPATDAPATNGDNAPATTPDNSNVVVNNTGAERPENAAAEQVVKLFYLRRNNGLEPPASLLCRYLGKLDRFPG